MAFTIHSLLDAERLLQLRTALAAADAPWQPGEQTAGWHARLVKHNHQLDCGSDLHQRLSGLLQPLLIDHPLVRSLAFPRRIHGLLFSRMGPGQGYGDHVDNAWMAEGRSDLSFTLFLSSPEHYQGGALVLNTAAGERSVRLPAGDAFVYPSTLLHRVEPVISGERLVVAGWIESRIREVEQRDLLFDLDTARRLIFQAHGKDDSFDLISRCYSNLLRRWDR
jgi:PKHD-type hydroxylase